MGNNTYSQYRDHPLRDVPQGVLDAARAFMEEAAKAGDVDTDMARPLADAVVLVITKAGYKFVDVDERTW